MPAQIMIVEDDDALLNALSFALEAEGWTVVAFADPAAALAATPAAACIVADFKLPGMDGLELIAALRARGVGAPAILTTASPDARCRARAAAAGVTIVEKPLVNGELKRRIQEALKSA